MHASCVEGDCCDGRVCVGLRRGWARVGGCCCCRVWLGVGSGVVVGYGRCVCWVLVCCGFYAGLVGVGGVRLVMGVVLLGGGRVPCLALLDTQLCLCCVLDG